MDEVIMNYKETFILGDFNYNLLWSTCKWSQTYPLYGLEQLIDRPTRVTDRSATLTDHIYGTSKQNIVEVCSPTSGCSDHFPLCLTWMKQNVKIPKASHKDILYRSFAKFDSDKFLFDLSQANLEFVYQIRDPDQALDFWLKSFTQVYDKHAPFKEKRIKYSPKHPWLTKEIEAEIHYRDKLLKDDKKQSSKYNETKSLLC